MFLESDSLNSAGQKVGICRRFQVFVCLRRLLVDWSSLLVVLVRANLREPWMSQSVFVGVVEPMGVNAGMPGAGERSVQTKTSVVEEITELSKVLKNATHCTMSFLANPHASAHVCVGGHFQRLLPAIQNSAGGGV